MPEDPKNSRLRNRLQRRVRGAVERAGVRALEAARPTVRRALEVILEEPLPARPAEPTVAPEPPAPREAPPRAEVPEQRDIREPLQEVEGRAGATPLEGAPPLPPDLPPGGPVGPGGDAATPLMQQLSHLTIATNEIYNRLVELGYQDAADAIVRVPKMPTVAPEVAVEPPPPVEPPEEPPPEVPEIPEARYLLQGSNLFGSLYGPRECLVPLEANVGRGFYRFSA